MIVMISRAHSVEKTRTGGTTRPGRGVSPERARAACVT